MSTNTNETSESITIDEYCARQYRARRAFVAERRELIEQFLKDHSSEADQLALVADYTESDVVEALAHSPFLSVRKAVLEATAEGEYAYAWATIANGDDDDCAQEAAALVREHGESGDLVATLDYIVNG